ncbi:hypothetical protein [Streptomyces sp. NPDC057616]|uniref:hypothetical protein n=1 Tax=Streptomyces sp. NPDC057616 TaxID=3346183 RepID=UPI00368EA932
MGTDPLDGPSASGDGVQSEGIREQRATEQQRVADERERLADIREAAADEREAAADRREAAADTREATVDGREAAVEAWQDQLATQERRLDARHRAAGDPAPGVRERSYEQIHRSQRLMAASRERLERSEAALRRLDARDQREQDAIDRETATAMRQMPAAGPVSLADLQTRADRLREQATAAAEALAQAEDALVHAHRKGHRDQQAAEHRRRAAQARTAAGTLRAITQSPEEGGTAEFPG